MKSKKPDEEKFRVWLSWRDLDDIISDTLKSMGYQLEREQHSQSVRYEISDERGKIAWFRTAAPLERRFEHGFFDHDILEGEERTRILQNLRVTITKWQRVNKLVERGKKKASEAAETTQDIEIGEQEGADPGVGDEGRQSKRKRGQNLDTPHKLERLREIKREHTYDGTVHIAKSKACELAGIWPKTVRANDMELWKRWEEPGYGI